MDCSNFPSSPDLFLSQKQLQTNSPLIEAASGHHSRDPSSSLENFPTIVDSSLEKKRKLHFTVDESHQSPIIRRSPVGKTVEPDSPVDSQISALSAYSPARSSASSDARDSRGGSITTSSLRTPRLWTPEEDKLLLDVIGSVKNNFCWPEIALDVPDRTGKQCRERYLNHLGPHLKRTAWTALEDTMIFRMYASHGSKWSQMVKYLPGRTDNGIKNRYHHLRRRFQKRMKSVPNSHELKVLMKRIEQSPSYQSLSMDAFVVKYTALRILNDTSKTFTSLKARANGDGEYQFGPFYRVRENTQCGRCGLIMPSKETGSSICSKTGWCKRCTGVSVVVTGDVLRLIHLVSRDTNCAFEFGFKDQCPVVKGFSQLECLVSVRGRDVNDDHKVRDRHRLDRHWWDYVGTELFSLKRKGSFSLVKGSSYAIWIAQACQNFEAGIYPEGYNFLHDFRPGDLIVANIVDGYLWEKEQGSAHKKQNRKDREPMQHRTAPV
ncbi:unnamed protein product [Pseudo-nitzschia multistriata]|uniref:Myb-like domain-containing protein n=1 Tax=Pseudo-nitzschia multistriata TaxID=183589 RepID=A0A448YZK1_9STRA|nr:unnamed protein product [Pseudo-nitzschia multistriata]